MRLKITDTNFTSHPKWLFKLVDEQGCDYYIMQNSFYEEYGLTTPVTKKHLDSLDKGSSIICEYKNVEGKRVIVNIG